MSSRSILVFNAGSSSLKASLYRSSDELELVDTGLRDRLGSGSAVSDHVEAAAELVESFRGDLGLGSEDKLVVAHRVVHGGLLSDHCLLDEEALAAIRSASSLAPLHNPPALAVIDYARREFGTDVPMVAAFDTAIFANLPDVARLYAIDRDLAERHLIRRYGFHGLAHSHMFSEVLTQLGLDPGRARVITLQLGNGCSVAAFSGGVAVDTSMGMTPLEGLIMGTRSGDLDPSLIGILAAAEGVATEEVDTILNEASGLLGVSGLSSDMADLARAEADGHEGAALARRMFAYRVRKYIGAYVAALGGVDALVFGGGIGENDEVIRGRIVDGLGSIGIGEGMAPVAVVPVDEMSVIARAAARLVG